MVGLRAASALALLLVACSESASPQEPEQDAGIEAPPSLAELRNLACNRWATAWCGAQPTCRPQQFRVHYADVPHCVEVETRQCEKERFLPGTGWTPERIDECVAALDWSSCHAVINHDNEKSPIPECSPRGTLADGEPCMRASQCLGGACFKPGGAICGQCGQATAEGGPCQNDSECGAGLRYCRDGTCEYRDNDLGEPCQSIWHCYFDLACIEGSCSPKVPAGGTCGTYLGCSPYPEALWCNSQTKKCEQTIFQTEEGAPCPALSDGSNSQCVYPLGCYYTDPVAKIGECRPRRDYGEPCETSWGYNDHCRYPFVCGGTCIELNASICNLAPIPP